MKNNETKVTEEIKTEVTEEVIRDSRASEDRNATANEVVWTPPSSLDAPPAPDGFHHRWIRSESLGFNDNKNITGKLRSGYALVRSEEYKDSNYPIVEDGKYKGVIGIGGLLLMRCPVEVKEDRDDYFRNLTNDKTRAIESDLHKDEHPSMPIHQERQSRVTFGGKKS